MAAFLEDEEEYMEHMCSYYKLPLQELKRDVQGRVWGHGTGFIRAVRESIADLCVKRELQESQTLP